MVSFMVCQFCGVQFEMARLRRANEPRELAWGRDGDGWIDADEILCDSELCERLGPSNEDEKNRKGTSSHDASEHLAGPECTANEGYSGVRINAEEMKGFRFYQCLMPKPDNWLPTSDDHDYEISSRFFLSGIGVAPDYEELEVRYISSSGQRHGVDPGFESNHEMSISDEDYELYPEKSRGAVPFHPECFEIFTRISKKRLGRVDLNGIWAWRNSFPDWDSFHNNWPTDLVARDSFSDFWQHEPGSEYLAANPLKVPGLQRVVYAISKDYKALLREDGRDEQGFYIRQDEEDGGAGLIEEEHTSEEVKKQGVKVVRISRPKSRVKSTSEEIGPNQESVPDRDLSQFLSTVTRDQLCKCLTYRQYDLLMSTSSELKALDRACWRKLIEEDLPWLWEIENLRFSVTDFKKLYARAKYSLPVTFKGLYNRKRIWEDMELICNYIASLDDDDDAHK